MAEKARFTVANDLADLVANLRWLFRVTVAKDKSKELGFICLFTDGAGQYWFKCSRGFHTALNESIASLETLIDETADTLDASSKGNRQHALPEAQQFLWLTASSSSMQSARNRLR